MSRGGYRFETWAGVEYDDDAYTIDGAIAIACKKSLGGQAIVVVDRTERQPIARGCAILGIWYWAKSCSVCDRQGKVWGAWGNFTPCAACDSKGWLPDDAHTGAR